MVIVDRLQNKVRRSFGSPNMRCFETVKFCYLRFKKDKLLFFSTISIISEYSVQNLSTPRIRSNATSGLKSIKKREKGAVRSETISSSLSQSLAIALVKVQKGCGNKTAIGILEILQDESFDFQKFKK